jgi:hypothetical protein
VPKHATVHTRKTLAASKIIIMKIFTTISIINLIIVSALWSQALSQNILWADQFSGNGAEAGNDITISLNGNVYSVGQFEDSTDFDPGTGIYLLQGSLYISKLGANGNFIWAKALSATPGVLSGISITTDDDENIYVTGIFAGTQDFDPGPNSFLMTASPYNSYVLKLSSAGNFVWAKKINSGNFGWSNSIAVHNNFICITGWFQGISDFDPGVGIYNLTSNGYEDIFVSKWDTSGSLIWANSFGGIWDDNSYSVIIDSNEDVILSGEFRATVDFDPGIGFFNLTSFNNSTHDAFVCKYDFNGSLIWARQTNGSWTHSVITKSMATDINGNLYLTGYYSGADSVDFDPGIGSFNLKASSSFSEIFVWKLYSNGSFGWVKDFKGPCSNWGQSISVDSSSFVHSVGVYCGTVDFDPDSASNNLSSNQQVYYYSVLDSMGHYKSVKSCTTDSSIRANSISIDATGNCYVTGYFKGMTNFDPGATNLILVPLVKSDVFILKYGIVTNVPEAGSLNDSIFIFPNPCQDQFYVSSNSKIEQLNVYNIYGIRVYSISNIFETIVKLKASGLYVVETIINNVKRSTKIISIN